MKVFGSKNFDLGQVVITTNAIRILDGFSIDLALERHASRDWGEMSEEDWRRNNWALKNGERLLSAHTDVNGTKFWIITEAGRVCTTVMLPEDY
jgi:hypothetical protein